MECRQLLQEWFAKLRQSSQSPQWI